jgi:hypothetical protein
MAERIYAWYDGTTMVVQVGTTASPLRDEITGAVITNATIQVTVRDGAGNPVAGVTWPITLTHVGGGIYRASVPVLTLTNLVQYTARIIATVAGNQRTWDVPIVSVPASGS